MTKKKAIIISVISFFVVSTLFVVFTLFYRYQVSEAQTNDIDYKSVRVMTQRELEMYSHALIDEEPILLYQDPVELSAKINEYTTTAYTNSAILLIGYIVVVGLLTVLLWKLINQIHLNRLSEIAKRVIGENKNYDVSDIENVMQVMKDDLNRNANDYRRLHSYLAHEQKNALAIVRSKIELQNTIGILDDLDGISSSIDDLLTLSEDRYQLSMEEIELVEIAAKVVDEFSRTKNIEFTFDEYIDTTILGEERWLHRAISNLLDNAIKYGEDKPILVSLYSDKDNIIVEVKDYGIGIADEQKSVIFQNRYRINELNKNGYGIGLSLVKHVCDLCNGFVWVSSTLGQGSTFYLSFPRVYKRGDLNE